MGKSSRTKARDTATTQGEVGPRQPCPCGSGRRYKACHGAPGGPPPTIVSRPFEGLEFECDLVALRELVPAATAPLRLEGSDRDVRLCTLLPGAAPALVRANGDIWLGLQVTHSHGDPSRDLGAVLEKALTADEGPVPAPAPGEGPRLQDLVVSEPLDITVHEGFDYWLDDVEDKPAAMLAVLEQANEAAMPTTRLSSVEAAYWTNVGTKEHLRWPMPYAEDELLDALAKLHVAGRDKLVEEGRLVGMFRAHGLLVPVWDLPVGTGAAVLEEPAAAFAQAVAETVSAGGELTPEERAARSGLANRQVTIR
jgi:hypothetical protein